MGWRDWAFVILLPPAAWGFLDINPVLQLAMVDPWFYTGMGPAWQEIVQAYGWGYYYVRFPIGFLNGLASQAQDPMTGYLLLRWAICSATLAAVYLAVLRIYGRAGAVVAGLFLMLNPLFIGAMNSDYTPFVSVPASIIGVSLWLAGERRRWLWCVAAGAAFAVSANCHIFTSTATASFALGIVAAQLFARRSWRQVLVEGLAVGAGFGLMCVIGALYMRSLFPQFEPQIALNLTTNALRDGGNYARDHAQPFLSWGAQMTYIYVPYLLLAAAAFTWRGDPRRWAVLIGASILLGFYFVYRFQFGRFIFETHYYYVHTMVAAVFLAGAVGQGFSERAEGDRRLWLAVIAGLVAAVALVHANNLGVWPLVARLFGNYTALFVLLGLVAFGWALHLRRGPAAAAGAALFFGTLQLLASIDYVGRECFAGRSEERQKQVYRVGVHYVQYWAEFVTPGDSPLIWCYSSPQDIDILSLTFTAQMDALHNKWSYGGMPSFGEFERKRLKERPRRHLFLIGRSHADVEQGTEVLLREGVEVVVAQERWFSSAPFRILVRVLEIKSVPDFPPTP